MKTKRLIPFVLIFLLLLETPFVSLAAELPPVSTPTEESPEQPESNFQVTLDHSASKLKAGSTLQLTPTFSGCDSDPASTPPQLTWTSDYPDIASVSADGFVTAHKAGTAMITAQAAWTTADGANTYTASASCSITVVNTISLNKKKLSLYTCESFRLSAATVPNGAVTWHSSNPKVLSVDSHGRLKPLKKGSATVTATANGVSASCEVTVKAATLSLPSKKTIYLKNPETLKAAATPKGTIKWKTSNPKIAAVNNKGKVTPLKTGTVSITASCNGIKKSCKITVKEPSVKLTTKKIIIFAKNDCKLKVKAHPSSNLSYQSSNPKVAKVSKDGTLTGVRPGSVTITASVPGAKSSCEVTVLENSYNLNHSSQTLMKGCSAAIYMSNIPSSASVSYEISDSSIAKLSCTGNTCKIKAQKAGKATLYASYKVYYKGQYVTCIQSCALKVIDSGIVQQQAALALGADKSLTLKRVNKSGTKIKSTTWKSSNPRVASVGRKTGKVKSRKYGSTKIIATVNYSDGTAKEYVTHLKVSTPKTRYQRTIVALGHSRKIALTGLTSFSNTKWKLPKKSLVSITPDGTVTAGYTPGETTVTINIDGKTIRHTVVVTNPSLKNNYTALAPKDTYKIQMSGVSAQSSIKYKSAKTSIATVSDSGLVTAHDCGTTTITIIADDNKFTFTVEVAPKRALDACKNGYNIMYSSTYSQARRMTTGYYDCSSLVFRAYGCDTGLLGGIPSWAPTAASMASYLESHGKVIAYHNLSASKLRPGDLLFYSGSYNGRYRNINHVSMYYGNGYRLEKPLRPYYSQDNLVMIARPVN